MDLNWSSASNSQLAQMAFIAEREAGRRFRLSRQESVLDLLRHVAQSKNEELRKLFDTFLGGIDARTRDALSASGLSMDSNVAVDPTAERAEPAYRVSKRVYRGQVIEVREPLPAARPSGEPPAKRSRRVYRGQVIED